MLSECQEIISMPLPSISLDVVALHNKPEDLWIVVDQVIYDVSKFQHKHPGGHKIFKGVAGRDATKPFHKNHNKFLLSRYEELKVGIVALSVVEEKKVFSMLSRVLGWRKQGAVERQMIGMVSEDDKAEVKEIEVVEIRNLPTSVIG